MKRFARESLPALAFALIAIAMLATSKPADAQTQTYRELGRTDIASTPSAGLSANFKRGSRFTLSENATLDGLCAYLDGLGGASGRQDFRLALYSDSNGVPAAKLADTSAITIVSGASGGWRCSSFSGYSAIPPGAYWIVIHTGSTAGVIRNFGDGAANWYGNADTYSDGPSSTFGSGNPGSGTLSLYGLYQPDSSLRNVGRTTVGTQPSSGMSANFKRVSSFTMTEPGRLAAMTGFVDGLGGATGTQSYRYVLYRDASGSPGEKVTESRNLFAFPNGRSPAWITDSFMPPLMLDPGRYWIGFHTDGTAGVLRNYADGTGNWYGNADTFSDGAASPFGVGNAGNGTLSAFVSYIPGPFITRTLGRTDVAATPSKGLGANMMRGSQFIANNRAGVLTSLSAYLDGLGGGTGSQKVRMALYQYLFPDEHSFLYRIAESQEVTIAAGTPPGWVHFPVPPTSINEVAPVFYIMIESGDIGGIVRNYGDGPANWASLPIDFAQGGPDSFDDTLLTYGNVTLSVYGTYTEPQQ
jgi:hypothetical protein